MFLPKFLSLFLSIFLATVVDRSDAACAGAYGQCGGIGWQGATCCIVGYTCTKDNDYYFGCQPATDPNCSNQLYSQCGGQGWTGTKCCPAGSNCVASDAFYSQCRPADSGSATSTTARTTTRAATATTRPASTTRATTGTTTRTTTRASSTTTRPTTTRPTSTTRAGSSTTTRSTTTSTRATTTTPRATTTTRLPITTTTTRATTTRNTATTTRPPSTGFNYAEVLGKSLVFFYGQVSGRIPANLKVSWRSDSTLNDGKDVGVDLTGGYFDAGDHVKFNFPQSYALYMLALSGLHHEATYKATGQEWQRLLNVIKWGTDYFLKCHNSTYEFYVQVGDGIIDHAYWGKPELIPSSQSRPSFKITASAPGSDMAGSAAATFALTSMLFKNVDPSYSAKLLQHARQMFDFATKYQGKYSDSVPKANPYYTSSGFKDEQILGALALYWATNETTYRQYAHDNSRDFLNGGLYWAPVWDNAYFIDSYLLWKLLGDTQAQTVFENWANWFMTSVPKTPQGFTWLAQWGPLRYPLSSSTLMMWYVDSNPNLAASKAQSYVNYAVRHMNYVLGNNTQRFSYIVGFGDNYPTRSHHRGSHGSTTNNMNDPPMNLNVNYMLVGGPDAQDNYQDNINNYQQAEGALDMQVGLTALAAALVKRYGGTALVNFP